jgi:hypothetical protein
LGVPLIKPPAVADRSADALADWQGLLATLSIFVGGLRGSRRQSGT